MSREDTTRRPNIAGALKFCGSAFFALGLISMVINVLMLTGPLFMLQIYDRVLTSRSVPTLIALAGLVGGLYVFFALLDGLRARALIRIGQRLDARLASQTFAAAVSLPVATGKLFEQVEPIRDLEQMRQFLAGPGPTAIFDIPWLPIYLAIVFLFHPYLGWLATAGAATIVVLLVLNETLSRRPASEAAGLSADRTREAATARRNAEAIAAMGMLDAINRRWTEKNERLLAVQGKGADWTALFSTLTKALRFGLQSAVLGFGAWLVLRQEITAGVMITASIITSRALAPVELAVAHWRNFVVSRQGLRRLAHVFDVTRTNMPQTQLPLPAKSLDVRGLASGPADEKLLTVHGVSFSLAAGDGLGIIGPSGSGKTSLLRAMLGVWPIRAGSVRLDGSELSRWEPRRIGQAIGYLPQDVELFAGTVAENIARFDPDWRSDVVIAAARLADVHDLIAGLPDGYDTQIGEDGAHLSAGQRQRIGLARALYGSPFLIALDEPNSNLDAQGEAALGRAIAVMREQGRIVVIVAHRPSAMAAVDLLLCLKDGRQQAFGPKDEVLQQVTCPAPTPDASGVLAPASFKMAAHG